MIPNRTVWFLEHLHHGILWHWRFERTLHHPQEVTVINWQDGKLIATRQIGIHDLERARDLWNFIVKNGAVLTRTEEQCY